MPETVDILSTHAVKLAFDRAVLPDWKAKGGHYRIEWAASNLLADRIMAGQRGDVVVLIDSYVRGFADAGIVVPSTVRPIARAEICIGVRADRDLPPVRTVAEFVQVLESARAVAWSSRGASGVHFDRLIDQLGLGAEFRRRGVIVDAGFTATKLIMCEADIAIQLASEIMSVEGVKVAAPLPAPLQKPTDFSAAVFVDAANPGAGRRLVRYLAGMEAGKAYAAGGLVPALFSATRPL